MMPMPPTANTYWRTRIVKMKNPSPKQLQFTGGYSAVTYTSEDGKHYAEQVKERFFSMDPRPAMSSSALCIEIVVCFATNARQDIDNRVKPLLDALKGAGLMQDDMQVVDLRVRRGPVIKEGRVVVRVWEVVPNYDRALYATGWGRLAASP